MLCIRSFSIGEFLLPWLRPQDANFPHMFFSFYKFLHPTAKVICMQICLSDHETFLYPLKMPENGSFQNLLTPPTFYGSYSYYRSSVRETLKLNFMYYGLYVYEQGKFRTNKGNFNRSKRTKPNLILRNFWLIFDQNVWKPLPW